MFEIIQLALADLSENLTPYMPYIITIPIIIYVTIVNMKLQYPTRGEPFWTDNVKRVTIQTWIGAFVFGALVGFFLQSTFRSVYSLLLIPLFILVSTVFGTGWYIFGLYLIYEGRKRKK